MAKKGNPFAAMEKGKKDMKGDKGMKEQGKKDMKKDMAMLRKGKK